MSVPGDQAGAGSVHIVRLERPQRRNSLDGATFDRLSAELALAGERTTLIIADPPSFCAGFDLDWLKDQLQLPDGLERAARRLLGLYDQLLNQHGMTVALVDGPAVGGGVGLALCCDRVVATPRAWFFLPGGDLASLAGLVVPYVRRRTDAWDGARIDATEALQLGLVDEIVDAPPVSRAREEAGAVMRVQVDGAAVLQLLEHLLAAGNRQRLHDVLAARGR